MDDYRRCQGGNSCDSKECEERIAEDDRETGFVVRWYEVYHLFSPEKTIGSEISLGTGAFSRPSPPVYPRNLDSDHLPITGRGRHSVLISHGKILSDQSNLLACGLPFDYLISHLNLGNGTVRKVISEYIR